MAYRVTIYLVCILFGLVSGIVTMVFLEYIIFPDPCYYHEHEPNFIISLLYDFPSWNGNHPVTSTAFMIFLECSGALAGWYIARLKISNII